MSRSAKRRVVARFIVIFAEAGHLMVAIVGGESLDSLSSLSSVSNEYLRSQRDGRVWDDCSAYHNKCPVSFFQVWKHFVWSLEDVNDFLTFSVFLYAKCQGSFL